MSHTCNCAGKQCGHRHLGMFALRAITGIILGYVGWMKLQNIASSQAHFVAMHLAPWMATATAWIELVGGIALILGLFTCFFAAIFTIGMIVSAVYAWKAGGFPAAMLPLLLAASAFALKHGGRGKWGIGRHCGCMFCSGQSGTCPVCGHDPKMGGDCGCDCHK